MRASALALALALLPLPALALTAMTAEEFERYATGRTLSFALGGVPYGAEQYLPGRRVRWAFTGEECRDGIWYEDRGLICFVYTDDPEPQCWTFYRTPDGVAARYENDPEATMLIEVGRSPEPLACPGPDVGV